MSANAFFVHFFAVRLPNLLMCVVHTQNPSPNAYTLAIAGRKPFIVVHSALLELMEPAEVQAVLAHELGHLKCDHGVCASIGMATRMTACILELAAWAQSVQSTRPVLAGLADSCKCNCVRHSIGACKATYEFHTWCL